uniref:BZIP domain-containing protein n=1 Tax=Caenorhabditis japonica TaxID=281687 RepID=A0A8R1HJ78_CAEJA
MLSSVETQTTAIARRGLGLETLSGDARPKQRRSGLYKRILIVERIEGNETNVVPLKRKLSDASSVASKRPRAAPVSLVNLSDEEIAERKKQQNRAAALRYRQKLRESRVSSNSAKQTLTQRNAYLRDEAERLTSECEVLRRLIFDKLGKNAPVF